MYRATEKGFNYNKILETLKNKGPFVIFANSDKFGVIGGLAPDLGAFNYINGEFKATLSDETFIFFSKN